MPEFQVILRDWPHPDVRTAAPILARVAGGTAADRAQHLARCRGIVAERMAETEARALILAWRSAGIVAAALPVSALPELPRPVLARVVDFRDPAGMQIQISLTGPPDLVASRHLALVLPARWQTAQQSTERVAPRKATALGLALDLATTGGVRTALAARPSGNPAARSVETQTDEPLVELVALEPPRRIHVFARRLDYRTLRRPLAERLEDNWRQWLLELQAFAGPHLAAPERLAQMVTSGTVARDAVVSDANDLGRTARWLLLRAMALGQRSAGAS